jgi:ElaB/YqjD/DUF883 family membrane-anchored ribosome-binding protein
MQSDYHPKGGPGAPQMSDPNDLTIQVAQLRAELRELVAQVEKLMSDRAAPAVADITNGAEEAVLQAKDIAREKIEDIADEVRERPVVALLLAAGAGYIAGRVRR